MEDRTEIMERTAEVKGQTVRPGDRIWIPVNDLFEEAWKPATIVDITTFQGKTLISTSDCYSYYPAQCNI